MPTLVVGIICLLLLPTARSVSGVFQPSIKNGTLELNTDFEDDILQCNYTGEIDDDSEQRLKASQRHKVVCYYTSWAIYRNEDSTFPEDIDPFLCTHILHAFAVIRNGEIVAHDPADLPTGQDLYRRVTSLKKKNPKLKVMLAVGGFNMGSEPFIETVRSDQSIKKFVNSVMRFMKNYNFDGLDLDWEYPVDHKEDFTKLCKALKRRFTPKGYLLSAAVSAGVGDLDRYYEADKICKILDFVNIMTYDFHGCWDANTQGIAHHSPLDPRQSETDWRRDFNVRAAAKAWRVRGCDPKKLIIGIPTYGKSYTLSHPSKNNFGDIADCGPMGPLRKDHGWAFYEVCHAKRCGGWTYKWHKEHKVPYMYNDRVLVAYDDDRSARIKAKFIVKEGYGGAMFWTIDFDDVKNRHCGKGTSPMINAVNKVFKRRFIKKD